MENSFETICSFQNLELAYRKARKGKRNRPEIAAFELHAESNLLSLKRELESGCYQPRPLRAFVIRDPKTRRISASAFRDRVVHHALCNVIAPLFERSFIHDSYANRKDFGTHKALIRFDAFKRRASCNGRLVPNAKYPQMVSWFCLKADISRYFASSDHELLISFLGRKIKDQQTLHLIRIILEAASPTGKGLPLGNLASQFFANAYLSQLDDFVKHQLRAQFYIRYVDDFVILHRSGTVLEKWKEEIRSYLVSLGLVLHPGKSAVKPLHTGAPLLGFRVFPYHRLLKKNTVRLWNRGLKQGAVSKEIVNGWLAHAAGGDTYRLRKQFAQTTVFKPTPDNVQEWKTRSVGSLRRS